MWRTFLYSGFETCFGPSTQGAGTKTHLKSRFCAILTTFTPHYMCRYTVGSNSDDIESARRALKLGIQHAESLDILFHKCRTEHTEGNTQTSSAAKSKLQQLRLDYSKAKLAFEKDDRRFPIRHPLSGRQFPRAVAEADPTVPQHRKSSKGSDAQLSNAGNCAFTHISYYCAVVSHTNSVKYWQCC